MINIDIDKGQLNHIEVRLGNLSGKTPDVLKNAINQTATQVRERLASEAQKEYTIKTARFKKEMRISRASNQKLRGIIRATGEVQSIRDFNVSPSEYNPKNRGTDAVMAQIMNSGKLISLQKGNLKAFVSKFKNKHIAVVQRVEKGKVPARSKLGSRYVKKLFSPSIPVMLGNEKRVYGKIEPDIKEYLRENINKQIARILGG